MFPSNLIKKSGTYLFFDVLRNGMPFFLLPILFRAFGPQEYGMLANFNNLLAVLLLVVGLNSGGLVEVSFFKASDTDLKRIISAVVCLGIFVTTTLCLLALPFLNFMSHQLLIPQVWLLAVIPAAFFQFTINIQLTLYQTQEQPLKFGYLQFLQSLTNFVLTLLLVFGLHLGPEGRLAAITATNLVFFFLCFRKLSSIDYIKKMDLSSLKEAAIFGAPLVVHGVAGWILTGADKFVINSLIDTRSVGAYSAAFQLALIVNIICIAFNRSFVPWLFRQLSSEDIDRDKIVRGTYLMFAVILSGACIYGLVATHLAPYLLGEEFRKSAKIILPICIGFGLNGLYLLVVNYIFFLKRTKLLAKITLSISALHLALCMLLTFYFGLHGAVAAFVISNGLSFLTVWVYSHQVYPMPWIKALTQAPGQKIVQRVKS